MFNEVKRRYNEVITRFNEVITRLNRVITRLNRVITRLTRVKKLAVITRNLPSKYNIRSAIQEKLFSRSEPGYMTSGGVPGEDFGMQNSILRVPGLNF